MTNVLLFASIGTVVIALLFVLFYWIPKERKKRKLFQNKYYAKCLELKKSEIGYPTFVKARNALTYLYRVVPKEFTRREELHALYVERLTDVIKKSKEFDEIDVIFASFEKENEKDRQLWNDVKNFDPEVATKVERMVTNEVLLLQSCLTQKLTDDIQRQDLYLAAEGLHGFLLKQIVVPQQGSVLESQIKTLKAGFQKKKEYHR